MQGAMYPNEAVQHMRDELTSVGLEELLTPEDVEKAVKGKGVTMVVVNSVCGCAAGGARPAVGLALQHKVIPDRIATVFAGMERDAVEKVRSLHKAQAAPSSPSIAFFKDGACIGVVERSHIERQEPRDLAAALTGIFDKHCTRPGPSIAPEKFSKLSHAKICGSSIPRME